MRIGEVTKDNYKQYLQMLGLKNAKEIEKSIDRVWGKDKEDGFDHSIEAAEKYIVARGWGIEGMTIDGNTDDGSWKKIVPVSDEIRQKIIGFAREIFMQNGNGMVTAEQGDELTAIRKEYLMTLSPSKRLSASWTLGQIYIAEGQRLMNYVRANMPNTWKPGDPIDPDVLKAAVSGESFDAKV